MKVIKVTSAQVNAAKRIVARSANSHEKVSLAVRKLAEAKHRPRPAAVVIEERYPQLWDVENSAEQNNGMYEPSTRRRPQVSAQEARHVYDGPSERVEVVPEWADEHGIEVHEPRDGIVYKPGSRNSQEFDIAKPADSASMSWRDKQ